MDDAEEKISLGNLLRNRREETGISVAEVAQGVQATTDFIIALEEGNYGVFSAKVYARGFFKKVLAFLEFENQAALMDEFDNQWLLRDLYSETKNKPLPENRSKEPVFTLSKLSLAMSGIFLLLFLVFLSIRLSSFVFPPKIYLNEPKDSIAVKTPQIKVAGRTEKESRETI